LIKLNSPFWLVLLAVLALFGFPYKVLVLIHLCLRGIQDKGAPRATLKVDIVDLTTTHKVTAALNAALVHDAYTATVCANGACSLSRALAATTSCISTVLALTILVLDVRLELFAVGAFLELDRQLLAVSPSIAQFASGKKPGHVRGAPAHAVAGTNFV
jgi:hypothetical protein